MVILATFLSVPQWDAESNGNLDVCEFFAGKARVSKLALWVGYRVRAYDINFEPPTNPGEFKRGKLPRSPMDLNGNAGMVILGWFGKLIFSLFPILGNCSVFFHPDICSLTFKQFVHLEACYDPMHERAASNSIVHHSGCLQYLVGCKLTYKPAWYLDAIWWHNQDISKFRQSNGCKARYCVKMGGINLIQKKGFVDTAWYSILLHHFPFGRGAALAGWRWCYCCCSACSSTGLWRILLALVYCCIHGWNGQSGWSRNSPEKTPDWKWVLDNLFVFLQNGFESEESTNQIIDSWHMLAHIDVCNDFNGECMGSLEISPGLTSTTVFTNLLHRDLCSRAPSG